MRIALIGAMEVEVQFLVEQITDLQTKKINNFNFHLGKIENIEVIVVKSGIGKTMSGILIGTLVSNFTNITHIINVGVSGGVEGLEIGDVLIGSSYVYGDVDLTSAGDYAYGRMAGFPFIYPADQFLVNKALLITDKIGTICTTDQFMVDILKVNRLINDHFSDIDIYAFDMESAAFAQASYFFNIPFIAIRAISDIIGSTKEEDKYDNNLDIASLNSNKFIIELLKQIAKK